MIKKASILVLTASVLLLAGGLGWQATAWGAQDEEKGDGESGRVTLRLAGDKGTPFSGTCSVGGKQHDIGGRVPQSFEYEPNDRRLACKIRTQDAQGAELKVVLEDANTRSVQRSEGAKNTAIRLVYENGSVSSSMSSSTSQKMSSTSISATSALSDAREGDDSQENLADQIQKKVARIIERAGP